MGQDEKKKCILLLAQAIPPGFSFVLKFLKKRRMQIRARNFWLDWNERLQWEQNQIERFTGRHPTSCVKR